MQPHHKKKDGPFYFADVCAGPGGFSEYILWRKEWLFKGFGFTLKGDNDFKLSESTCASSVTFNSFYGVTDDGNVCNPENIKDFAGRVMNETENKGVHFMMSDGVRFEQKINFRIDSRIFRASRWTATRIYKKFCPSNSICVSVWSL